MRIFIIGFMFCGKSTVGKKLASSMGLDFIDTDKYFEDKYKTSVIDFFNNSGEEMFRKCEYDILQEIITKENVVISTGGGLPCFNNNIDLINKSGISLYLKMSFSTIIHRQRQSKQKRPLLQNKSQEEIEQSLKTLYHQREHIYNKAKVIIKGEEINIKDINEKITSIIR